MTQKTQTHTHTNTETLSRPTVRRREQAQCCTNFNSHHATDNSQFTSQRTCTHMRSARPTLEWRVRPCVLRTASALTVLNHWPRRLAYVHMFAVRKHKSNGSRCLVIRTSKGNSDGDSQRSVLQLPMCSCDRTVWWTFFCHNVDVGTRKFLNCTSDRSCAEKLQWNPVLIQPENICSRAQSWSWKDFVFELGLYGIPKSYWEWRHQGKHLWMLAAWHSSQCMMPTHNYNWSPWTHYARYLDIRYIIVRASNYVHDLKFKRLSMTRIEVTSETIWSSRFFVDHIEARMMTDHVKLTDDTRQRRWSCVALDDQKFTNSNTPWKIFLQQTTWETTIWRDETRAEFAYLLRGNKSRTKVTTDSLSEVGRGRIIWHQSKLVLTRDETSYLDSYPTEYSCAKTSTSH